MKRINILSLLLIVGLAFVLLLTTQATAAGPKTETLEIGVILPLSGGGGPWGIGGLRGLELMADKINGEGGTKVGNKKYHIELIKADDKTDFNAALAQANKLIFHNKVKFIVGSMITGCSLAILPVTEANNVMVLGFVPSPKILGPDKKNSFRLYPSAQDRMEATFTYLIKYRPEVKNIALISPNDESGWGYSKFARERAKELKYNVVFEDFLERGTTDLFPLLTKMVAKKPDVLINSSLPQGETALLLDQSHQLGYEGLIMSGSSYDPKILVAKAGIEATEGFVFQVPEVSGPSAPPGLHEAYKRYRERFKEELNPIALTSYHYLWILKMAIEKAGTLATTAVAEAMENLEGEMPYGHFSFGGLKTYGIKRQIIMPIFYSEIKNGKQVSLGSVMTSVP